MMNARVLTSMLSQPADWGWWGGAAAGSGWAGWWWIVPLSWLAFWAILVGLLAWYLLAGRRRSSLDEARRILAERYARGELSPEEYRQRLAQLR